MYVRPKLPSQHVLLPSSSVVCNYANFFRGSETVVKTTRKLDRCKINYGNILNGNRPINHIPRAGNKCLVVLLPK